MALAFLLDAHVPAAVADGVRAARPDCRVEHLARWLGGSLREAEDESVLSATQKAGLVLVAFDVDTIPDIVHPWLSEGRSMPAVALVRTRIMAQNDVGGIVRAIVDLYDNPTWLDSAYPVVYLRPPQ